MNHAHSEAHSNTSLDRMRARVLERRAAIATDGDDLDEFLFASAELMVARWRRARHLRADLETRSRSADWHVDRLPPSLMRTLTQVAEEEASTAIAQFLWHVLEETPEAARERRDTLRASREAARSQRADDRKHPLVTASNRAPSDDTRPQGRNQQEPDLYPPHDPLLLAANAMMEPWERAAALRDEWNRRAMLDEPMTTEQRFELIAAIDEAARDASDAFGNFMDMLDLDPRDVQVGDESMGSILDAYANLVRPSSSGAARRDESDASL